MKDIDQILANAENQLVKGKGKELRKQLLKLQHQGVPRRNVLEVARLAIRMNLFHFSAMILSKCLEEDWRSSDPSILSAYARSVAGLGNYQLAIEIFNFLPDNLQSSESLYFADCLFRTWNYEKGVELLLRADTSQFTEYRQAVFQLNLSAAYIQTMDFESARKLLYSLNKTCEKNDYHLLKGSIFELNGIIAYQSEEWDQAMTHFLQAEQSLRPSQSITWLYALKWLRICETKVNGLDEKNKLNLEKVCQQARHFQHWETLRDLDLQISLINRDQDLFSKCYFGTPHDEYRKYMLRLSKKQIPLNSIVKLNNVNNAEDLNYSIANGFFQNNKKSYEFKDQRKLLHSLFKDLYRPRDLYEIFRDIYDEPYFNKITSPNRVYKRIQRLKKDIQNSHLKIDLTSSKKFGYRLRATCSLNVDYGGLQNKNAWDSDEKLTAAKTAFPESSFSASELSNTLKMPQRTTNRWIREKIEKGLIVKIGSGKNTKYQIKKAG